LTVCIHPNALCESQSVGSGTRIWAFAHVCAGARIGSDCNICDGVFVENGAVVGDRVTVKCGVQLWDGVQLEDDVFVGPNATFGNDHFPRSKHHQQEMVRTIVRKGASIGANATILPGITIGNGATIGAGAVVTGSVPPYSIVQGNPARIVGYTSDDGSRAAALEPPSIGGDQEAMVETAVRGVTIHRLRSAIDLRGSLVAGEFERSIPFHAKRFFMVFDVPSEKTRGQHAHRRCHQFLVAANGRIAVVADDGRQRSQILLDNRSVGLHLPPMTWGTQYKYSPDAVLLVFASEYYDPEDYIRDYEIFKREVDET
jgi:acetyltransferase-like isoleucine patch superfamily enzyme/dTDP-4-dehydrorhamnose 3,5-epimerase-like enzyme